MLSLARCTALLAACFLVGQVMAQSAASVQQELAQWRRVVRDANIKPE